MQKKKIYAFFFIIALLSQGCGGGRTVTNSYYLLEFPANIIVNFPETKVPLQKSCIIKPVDVFPAFSTNQIAHRQDSHEIRYYSFNQWAVRPEPSFTRILFEFMDRYRVFENVYQDIRNDADCTIETTIQRLEVIRERNNYNAHLQIRLRMTDIDSGELIHEHVASSTKEMADRNLNLFAGAISEMFVEELSVFINEILSAPQK